MDKKVQLLFLVSFFCLHINFLSVVQNGFYFVLFILSISVLTLNPRAYKELLLYLAFIAIFVFLNFSLLSSIYFLSMICMSFVFPMLNTNYIRKSFIKLAIIFSLFPSWDNHLYTGVYGNNIMLAGSNLFALMFTWQIQSSFVFKVIARIVLISALIFAASKTHIGLVTIMLVTLSFPRILNFLSLRKTVLLLSIFAPIFYYLLLTNYLVNTGLSEIQLDGRSIIDLSGRSNVYLIIPEWIERYPLGIGLGQSVVGLRNFGLSISSPHNAWIKLLFELGIFGLLAWTSIMFFRIKKLNKRTFFFLLILVVKFGFDIFTPLTFSLHSIAFLLILYNEKRTDNSLPVLWNKG